MKLGSDVLLEIVAIVQNGFLRQEDISQKLRDIDLDKEDGDETETLHLSVTHKKL